MPFPQFSSFYFFNVTNPEEVSKKGAKPVLVEMGPYVFEQVALYFFMTLE